jgi:hypothetical protein
MMSSLANVVLFVALVTTSIIVGVMHRKLKRLDAYHAEYRKIFAESGAALISAKDAVSSFGADSRETLTLLSARVEEAKALIERLENLADQSTAQAKSISR